MKTKTKMIFLLLIMAVVLMMPVIEKRNETAWNQYIQTQIDQISAGLY